MDLTDGAVLSYVTSGDVDSLPVHMFAMSRRSKRCIDGEIEVPVWVYLSNPSTTYAMTALINSIERQFHEKYFAV